MLTLKMNYMILDIGLKDFPIHLKCYYDENHIFSIEAILRHKQVAYMRRKCCLLFQYLFLFQKYSNF